MHPYLLDPKLQTRWINFENPGGAPGRGGSAAGPLGVGRKGAPARLLQPGESLQLCDVEGPGTLRHFWCATPPAPLALRSLVLAAWWDDQEHPSIECPLGDLMGCPHGRAAPLASAVHSVDGRGSFHLWLPQPFRTRARLVLRNDGDLPAPFAFQIAATLGDAHDSLVGRLHVAFRRENPTSKRHDFELLPLRQGAGRLLGAVVGIRALGDHFAAEGEVKVYVDGDLAFPTLCGPGVDDWSGVVSGAPPLAALYHGAPLQAGRFTSLYRWHLPDPILWRREARATVQQIGQAAGKLIECADDWSAATFWYEALPSRALPALAGLDERIASLAPDPARTMRAA